ncbi:MAG: L-rhamnose/proton symporter RhaT, partial [Bacteroidales bacterium]
MEIISSFLIVIIASFFLGTFGLGMKYNKPLAWEAFWSIHSLTGMLVAPLIYAFIVVPDLFQTIITADQTALIRGCFFGFIWGIGGVLFGVSIK